MIKHLDYEIAKNPRAIKKALGIMLLMDSKGNVKLTSLYAELEGEHLSNLPKVKNYVHSFVLYLRDMDRLGEFNWGGDATMLYYMVQFSSVY